MDEMRRRWRGLWWLLAIAPAVCLGTITKPLNPDQGQDIFYRYPLVTAPLLTMAPEIDGTVRDEEWQGAAQFFPLGQVQSGEILPPAGVFRLAYTRDALCVAFRVSRVPEAATSRRSPRQIDHVEVLVRDLFGLDFEYSFAMDFGGRQIDGERREKFRDTARVKEWQGKTRRLPDGYEGEFAIPFDFFKRQTPKTGDMWEIQVLHHRTQPHPATLASTVRGMRQNSRDMGYLRFGDAGTPGLVWKLDAAGQRLAIEATGGTDRDLQVEARLLSPNGSSYGYYEALATQLSPAGDLLPSWATVDVGRAVERVLTGWKEEQAWSERLSYKVGGGAAANLAFPAVPGTYLLHCRVIDVKGGTVLGGGTWPIVSRGALTARVLPATLQLKSLLVVADYALLDSVPERSEVVVRLRQPGRDQILAEQRVAARPVIRQSIVTVPADRRLAGELVAEVSVESAARVRLATTACPVNVPEPPAWWGKQAGLGPRLANLQSPWTAIKFDDRRADVWGRTIDFQGRMLPAQITHLLAAAEPVDLLAGEVRLAVNGDQQVTFGQPRLLDRNDWKLTRTADVHSLGGGLRGSLTMELEVDGFIRYSLVLSPVGTRPVAVNELSLQIPLRRSVAQFYQAGPGDTRADRYHTAWTAGTLGDGGLELPFACNLWLGNRDLGLDLTIESDRNWSPMDRADAIKVRVSPEVALLRVDMMARGAAPITGEVRFEWGLLATPAKPRDRAQLQRLAVVAGVPEANQLTQRLDHGRVDGDLRRFAAAGANVWLTMDTPELPTGSRNLYAWQNSLSYPGLEPFGAELSWRQRALREFDEAGRQAGYLWMPVQMLRDTPANWPELQPWWHETVNYPTYGVDGGSRFNPTPVFQDWCLARVQQSIRDMGVRSIYTDSSPLPRFSANLATGDGWFDTDGRLRGKYPIFANRLFHQRLWRLLHGEAVSGGLIVAGNMPCMMPAVESFVDLHVAAPFVDWTTLMRQREGEAYVRYYGESRGLPVLVAPGTAYLEPASRIEGWAALTQLDAGYTALPSHLTGNPVELRQGAYANQEAIVIGDVWRAWKSFPWAESRWIPAWQADTHASCTVPGVRTALHVAPGKAALLMVSNYGERSVTARVQLHLDKLGLTSGQVVAVDAVLGELVDVAPDGAIDLAVPGARWRMVSLRPR